MIRLVTEAEDYLAANNAVISPQAVEANEDLPTLAALRHAVGKTRGSAILAKLDSDDSSVEFSNLSDVASLISRGPLTPDHVIRTTHPHAAGQGTGTGGSRIHHRVSKLF
jgi:rhamnose utilization protein RhaD (predicted bifunctional aldolase and dehydrogenase)